MSQTPCTVPDNGSGTVNLPPAGCGYVSPSDLHKMINGLPPGTTINVSAEHNEFFNVTQHPGGSLGGDVENFQSNLVLNMHGTGALAGYDRVVHLGTTCEVHTGPRTPGAPTQSFGNEMFSLQGQLPAGDPDFDLLRITAGSAFGMPSPGHTTLTKMTGTPNWNVDSFFDITYRIDFVGHPGGPLGGMSGSTTGTIRMGTGTPAPPPDCVVPDDGTGTVHLPPSGCGYLSPADVHQIISGLPPGTTVELGAQHAQFFGGTSHPGGDLGGEVENFGSILVIKLHGTGSQSGWDRTFTMQAATETHVAPRTPGSPVQSFDTEMFRLTAQAPAGDPDFDLLRITAGNAFGLPSPGHTTLTKLPGGNWNVDSFFDITYRIDFVGHPGGHIGGMSGSTTGTIRMKAGNAVTTLPTCFSPDSAGTVALPPANCGYISPTRFHEIVNGLPPGTTVQVGAQHDRFIQVTRQPGGTLGGEIETFNSNLSLNLRGTGVLGSFRRTIPMQVGAQVHTAPRTPGQPVQSFDTDMFRIQGQLPPGDPDFDLLTIKGGTFFNQPSPGHTTLTKQANGTFAVDSFFDITYTIDFQGKPGGHLGGMSGSTTATIRMSATVPTTPPVGTPVLMLQGFPDATQLDWMPTPNTSGYDVVSGSLLALQASMGDFTSSTSACLADNTSSTALPTTLSQPAGNGNWFLVRSVNFIWTGTYNVGGTQVGDRDSEILASGADCP